MPALHCHACGKPLKRFAVSIQGADGVHGFGPVCGAKYVVRKAKAGAQKEPSKRVARVRDGLTMDWVNEAAVAA